MASRIIPDAVRRVQIEAADPDVSAFVAANAGSGKTHVLTQRVINLLLRGCDPAKILCITFTKAAAANMANRVFGTLAEWTALDDAALDERIRLSTGKPASVAERARARRLFASALETPGGLKVQTIHAFCTRLLHQFPFEADVAARFTVLDEASTAKLLDDLTLDVLLEAAAEPDGALGRALATAITAAADRTFREVIGEAIAARDTIERWMQNAGSIDAAMAALSRMLGIDPGDTPEAAERDYFAGSLIPETDWPALIEALQDGSKSDHNHIDALAAAKSARGRERIDHYLRVFCTAELKPRKSLVTKAVAQNHPGWLTRLEAEQARVCALIARERALAARERTRALVTIASEVIHRYAREKQRRALLDYDDLIDRTLPLLADGSSAWVHYKLDLGIDHMLIDEAQDTSPKQWQIIRHLASEFTPGGARANTPRTLFAVGDEKQSIFSFQGAAPRAFDEMRHAFERQFDIPELGWRYLHFRHSFRSGANVLGSVDRVFKERAVYSSVTTDEAGVPEHLSLPGAAPGLVEIWPLIAPAKKQTDKEGWDAPFDTESEESPRVKLARAIAAQVKHWTLEGLKPGDVLVLVRQRGPLFEAIIRALKNAGVPVAGADRLVLTGHIAVMDLMALADAVLLPDDDLALASVLKSPLFGLNEEQLFDIAWNRTASLHASLGTTAAHDAALADVSRRFDAMREAAARLSPFAFFAHVLGPMQGRARILRRLGPEANDALDEFLNLALDYEARETPSLQGFLAFLRRAQSEVRRDMEMARDEVRVMTVHGAKGLEANTVILADTTTKPSGPHDPRLLALPDEMLVWGVARGEDAEAMTASRAQSAEAARDEYRRLLYVAMTRAAERLIVCGTQGMQKIPDGCWYQLVSDALSDVCETVPAVDGGEPILRYRKQADAAPPPADAETKPQTAKPVVLEDWLLRAAAPESPAIRTLTPSGEADNTSRPVPTGGAALALKRGSLVHRLMQSLPDLPAERRRKAAEDYLARAGNDLPVADRALIVDQVIGVLMHPRFQELYAPGSRAEVPIVGRIPVGGRLVRVSGQIDRLAVTDAAVLIADFKTNRSAPRRIEDVPPEYCRQLALYRAVLRKLYPDRAVRAALVWTEVPDLMELSDAVLDQALSHAADA